VDFRIKFLPLIIGGVLFFFGFQEWRLATKARGQPQRITAAQLEANGPGDNAHIELADFLFCNNYVYKSSSQRAAQAGNWETVWIPAVPLDGPYVQRLRSMAAAGQIQPNFIPPPDDVRIIIKSSKVKGEGDLQRLGDADTLKGVVVNEIESLGSEEKKHLQESYPGIDFSRCWIVQHEREPAGAGKVLGLMGGGGTLFLAGLAWLAKRED
jgi:hypothetical protein